MPPERLAEIERRHEKVEDAIFDGPVCRTCRHIDGAAVSYPCDAAIVLAEIRRLREEYAELAKHLEDTVDPEARRLLDAALTNLAAHQAVVRELVEAYDRCDSNRGAFSCVEPHDLRCPKSRADSPEKWKGKWQCECGRERLDAALAHPLVVAARTEPPLPGHTVDRESWKDRFQGGDLPGGGPR